MQTLERYDIESAPGGITITVNQQKNAVINIIFALAISGFSIFMIITTQDVSTLYYLLLGLGVLWLVISIYALTSKRSYTLTDRMIEYQSSGRSNVHTLSPENLSYISLHKIVRPSGNRKSKVPFPWRVRLTDNDETVFKQEFKFQYEANAQKLAEMISNFYEVEIRKSEA